MEEILLDGCDEICTGPECCVVGPKKLAGELKQLIKKGYRNDVVRIQKILQRLADFGRVDVNNKLQFRHEGAFPSGQTGKSKIPVYAVKSGKVRVYGGFVKAASGQLFVCLECAVKKRDEADQNQLKRVAKKLGDIQ